MQAIPLLNDPGSDGLGSKTAFNSLFYLPLDLRQTLILRSLELY